VRNEVWRVDGTGANASDGDVVWAPTKSIWNNLMLVTAILLGPYYFTWSAFFVFLALSYSTLLVGHSLGMHRCLIHQSFSCSKPLERLLVWLGVLVGMAGPFGIIRVHDIRDWAQREAACHDFFSHRRSLFQDAIWQLNCTFRFLNPPNFVLEPRIEADPWYRLMERTWPLHQLPLALCLYYFGGMAWVVWGISARIAVSVASHWVVTYFAHNPGPGKWYVLGAGVQASNLPWVALLTHGECWHNNHHAFPESAQLGLESGQLDTGWLVLRLLNKLGLVSRLGVPRIAASRDDLVMEASGHIK
jgi:fatty-acid desaturase